MFVPLGLEYAEYENIARNLAEERDGGGGEFDENIFIFATSNILLLRGMSDRKDL